MLTSSALVTKLLNRLGGGCYKIQLLSAASIITETGKVTDEVSPKKHSKEADILEATIFWGYRLNTQAQNSTCGLEWSIIQTVD